MQKEKDENSLGMPPKFSSSTMNMISYNSKIITENLKNINPNEQELLKMICPKCNRIGEFYRHGTYVRFLVVINIINGIIDKNKMKCTIQRIYCKNCHKTHAILHSDIIPYHIYSQSFILAILKSLYLEKKSKKQIYQLYQIDEATLRLFISYYENEQIDLKGFFKDASLPKETLLRKILNLPIALFLIEFFKQTLRHFFHNVSSNTFSIYPIRHFHIAFFETS